MGGSVEDGLQQKYYIYYYYYHCYYYYYYYHCYYYYYYYYHCYYTPVSALHSTVFTMSSRTFPDKFRGATF